VGESELLLQNCSCDIVQGSESVSGSEGLRTGFLCLCIEVNLVVRPARLPALYTFRLFLFATCFFFVSPSSGASYKTRGLLEINFSSTFLCTVYSCRLYTVTICGKF
jgi:hypothetical protein